MIENQNNLEAIFEAALELPPKERPAYLDRACGSDQLLRQQVERLLRNLHRAGKFLTQCEKHAPERTLSLDVPSEKPGDCIGRYKLLEKLGEGGFGVVYMAEQKQPVKRRVALKIIKIGMDTREVVARFEAERQALAIMDHPNIAKIFDAGATESTLTPALSHPTGGGAPKAEVGAGCPLPSDGRGIKGEGYLSSGRPYFVMELVRGIKITDYCDQNHLNTSKRLELFVQV